MLVSFVFFKIKLNVTIKVIQLKIEKRELYKISIMLNVLAKFWHICFIFPKTLHIQFCNINLLNIKKILSHIDT